jgi:hypothetical protein
MAGTGTIPRMRRKIGRTSVVPVIRYCNNSGHKEIDFWKKHLEKPPAKFAKIGASISDEIMVTNVVDLNVPKTLNTCLDSKEMRPAEAL